MLRFGMAGHPLVSSLFAPCIVRLITTLLVVALVAGCQQGTQPGPRSVHGLIPGPPGLLGTNFVIDVPAAWNGTLWLYSHGTIVAPPDRRVILPPFDDAPDPGTKQWLLSQGYALAATVYGRPTGWAVEDALTDQVALIDEFRRLVGRPARVIAYGDSQGGLDTVLLLERNRNLFAGGLSVCGLLGGGVNYFNHDLDMFITLDALLAPGSLIHAGAPTLAGIDSGPAAALIDQAQLSPLGRARIALVAAVQDFPERFGPTDPQPAAGDWAADERAQLEWTLFQLGTAFRQDVERRASGNPSSNAGVDYRSLLAASPYANEVASLYQTAGGDLEGDLRRLAAAPRISADPAAVQYMTEYGEPTGELRLPLLTIHTVGDGRVIPGNERAYADAVTRRGNPAQLRQLYVSRGGHCAFSDAEIIAACQALIQRIQTGHWPDTSPAAMSARAGRFSNQYARSAPLNYSIPDSPKFVDFSPPPLPR